MLGFFDRLQNYCIHSNTDTQSNLRDHYCPRKPYPTSTPSQFPPCIVSLSHHPRRVACPTRAPKSTTWKKPPWSATINAWRWFAITRVPQPPWRGSRARQCSVTVCCARARPLPLSSTASMRISNMAITRRCIWGRRWTASLSWISGRTNGPLS